MHTVTSIWLVEHCLDYTMSEPVRDCVILAIPVWSGRCSRVLIDVLKLKCQDVFRKPI